MNTKEISNCCGSDMIEPDYDEAEDMGSLYAAYLSYICRECGKVCKPVEVKQ